MKESILVPSVGESVTQGTLTRWLKREGDAVEEGEELFELETDKATVAVPAPAAGVLRILVDAGKDVEIGAVVGSLESAPPASPLARKLIEERGLDARAIAGTGPGGRITKEDALRAAQGPAAVEDPAGAAGSARAARETREPMSRLRRTLAARLVEARQQTALTTTYNEIDLGAVLELRKRHGEEFEKRHGARLGLMSFFVKACCRALKELPVVNSRIEGEDIVTCHYYDVGVAVSTERGLVVPVLRDADLMSFAQIEKRILELAERARERRLAPEELTGGTFTITNGGVFGSLLSAPLPNYPQAAILGMHAIQRRPVARDEQVVIRSMMYVALSYDHRLIDGREAVQFLVKVKKMVEEPERLLLDS